MSRRVGRRKSGGPEAAVAAAKAAEAEVPRMRAQLEEAVAAKAGALAELEKQQMASAEAAARVPAQHCCARECERAEREVGGET